MAHPAVEAELIDDRSHIEPRPQRMQAEFCSPLARRRSMLAARSHAYPHTQLCHRKSTMPAIDRRRFLQSSAATMATLSALTAAGAADRPNEKISLAFMGVHGRGKELIRGFSGFDDVEIATVCDPDENVIAAAVKEAERKQKKTPKVEKDVRRV